MTVELCRLDDIADGDSNRFVAEMGGVRRGYLAVRQGPRVFVYGNSCPHIGAPLDFLPGEFLNAEKTHIMCSTHGALFRIEDGYCISGPCAGKSLIPAPAEVREGIVYLV
ncbi:MAG: Rieske (2Fe-2S) protein [Rhodospirillales bacterium]|nr:Rieske (2Fe-2S) protein [Rhodospirillales bacterium]